MISRFRLNTVNIGCEAALGLGDGRDSFTDAGNFTISETFSSSIGNKKDNASQTYLPLPSDVIPQPILRLRVTVESEKAMDALQFEILSGAKHHLYQVVQYLKNNIV